MQVRRIDQVTERLGYVAQSLGDQDRQSVPRIRLANRPSIGDRPDLTRTLTNIFGISLHAAPCF